MRYIVDKVLEKLKNNDKESIVSKNEEIYRYGIELVVSSMMGAGIVFFEGMIMKIPLEATVFCISFAVLRIYAGGYHANSYTKCNILFAVCCGICLVLYKAFGKQITTLWCVLIFFGNELLIGKFAPIVHVHKQLDERRKCKCKRRGMIVIGIEFIATCFSCALDYTPGKILIFAVLLVDVLIFTEEGKRKYEKKNVRKYLKNVEGSD